MRRLTDSAWKWTAVALATGLGVGYVPFAPGTVGSLWGLPLVWGMQQLTGSLTVHLVVAAGIFALGIPVCTRAARYFGRSDPGSVVFDEIAAFPIVFFAIQLDYVTACAGFVWFRLFDILKPWPILRLERLPGGLGVMADDLMAAVYAAAALRLTLWLFGI